MNKVRIMVVVSLFNLTFCAELIKNPDAEGLFITGRGCGTTTPFKNLNYIPKNLDDFHCSFIHLDESVPGTNFKITFLI